MIVCLCRAKSERDVHAAIEEGASSLRDLQRCGIGTDCGSCHDMLRTMLAAAAEPAIPHVCSLPAEPATLATSA